MQSCQDETLTQVFLTLLFGIFLKQNYPKYISDVVYKILKKKILLSNLLLNLMCHFLETGFPVVKVENHYCQLFHQTDFGGFFVCC